MKAIVNNTELKKELGFISPIMKSNRVIPITESVLMSFSKKGTLSIRGTDLETVSETTIDCECKNDFTFCIPFDYLNRITNLCVSPMQFEITDKKLFITSSGSKNIHPINIDENSHFPLTPEINEGEIEFEADGTFFNYMSNAISFRSTDINNASFLGVWLDFKKEGLRISGCDKIMAFSAKSDISTSERASVMVPENFCNSCRLFQSSTVKVNDTHISAEYGHRKITCRLYENKPANIDVLISDVAASNVMVDIAEFKRLLNTSMVSSPILDKSVSLIFSKEKMNIVSEAEEFEIKSINEISVQHSVDIDAISFQGDLLMHIIACAEKMGNELEMSITKPNRLSFLKVSGNEDVIFLLMPLFSNN